MWLNDFLAYDLINATQSGCPRKLTDQEKRDSQYNNSNNNNNNNNNNNKRLEFTINYVEENTTF